MNNALVLPLSLIVYGTLTLYIPSQLAVLSSGEESILRHAREPLQAFFQSGAHSPLYALLLKATPQSGTVGPHWAGLLCGLAGIATAVRLLRGLAGAHAAPGALFLLAASPFLISQTRTLSPAPLVLLLVALSYALFWTYLRGGQLGLLAGWAVVSVLAFSAQASLIYLPCTQALIALTYRTRYPQSHGFYWPALAAVSGLWIALFWQPLNRDWTVRLAGVTPEQSASALDAFAALSTGVSGIDALAGAGLFALLLLSGLRACADWRKDARRGLLVGGLCVPCLLYALSPGNNALLVGALPPLCGLCAMGLRLYPRWARQGLWTALLLTYCWSYWHLYT
jgi:hypothetical protein